MARAKKTMRFMGVFIDAMKTTAASGALKNIVLENAKERVAAPGVLMCLVL
jgi:hypothetical protein